MSIQKVPVSKTLILYGISGRKGNGKSLIATAILRHMFETHETCVMSFATKLKQICHILFGGENRHWFGTDADKMETAPFVYWAKHLGENYSCARRIAQTVGTDIFRNNVHNNFWVLLAQKAMEDTLANIPHDVCLVIFDDVRYENEAEWLHSKGGQILEVKYTGAKTYNDQHSSEKPLPPELIDGTATFKSKEEVDLFAQHLTAKLKQDIACKSGNL